jgi:hypothetical protein
VAASVAQARRKRRLVLGVNGGRGGDISGQRCSRTGCAGLVELLDLLVEVVAEAMALDKRGVGFLQLVGVELNVDGLEVVDELVDPGEVQEGAVDGLGAAC